MNATARWKAKALMLAASVLAGGALLAYLVFVFSGALGVVTLGLSDAEALAWNTALSALFFAQHSGMGRKPFRDRLSRRVAVHYLDAIYALASGAVLALVVVLWQPTTSMLLSFEGPLRWLARAAFVLALAGSAWGTYSLGSFDSFGWAPIRAHLRGEALPESKLSMNGPYAWVRHPLYFFALVLIWSCPDLSADRLLFNVLWTAWICAGTMLEERDLRAEFGDSYRDYQKTVPMLVPWRGPVGRRASSVHGDGTEA